MTHASGQGDPFPPLQTVGPTVAAVWEEEKVGLKENTLEAENLSHFMSFSLASSCKNLIELKRKNTQKRFLFK